MEQPVPFCVRDACACAEEAPGPQMPPIPSSEDSGLRELLFYPKLGQLAWYNQHLECEQFSSPCGLLWWARPRHGPRADSTQRQGAESPAPYLSPATQEKSASPPDEEETTEEPITSSPLQQPCSVEGRSLAEGRPRPAKAFKDCCQWIRCAVVRLLWRCLCCRLLGVKEP
ncbi:annexin-2 receptor [Dugong dugon]